MQPRSNHNAAVDLRRHGNVAYRAFSAVVAKLRDTKTIGKVLKWSCASGSSNRRAGAMEFSLTDEQRMFYDQGRRYTRNELVLPRFQRDRHLGSFRPWPEGARCRAAICLQRDPLRRFAMAMPRRLPRRISAKHEKNSPKPPEADSPHRRCARNPRGARSVS